MIGSALALGGGALRWALHFYAAHFWLVFGLSMVPALQRFAVVRFGDSLPAAVVWGSEALTMAVRILLVYLVLRLMVAELGPMSVAGRWRLFTTGVDNHLGAFLLQFVLLGLAFVVFDVVPQLLYRGDQSILLAVKNPTVIAMTMLWMAGVGRILMGSGPTRLAA